MGNLGVGDKNRLGNRVGHGPQPGAENDADASVERVPAWSAESWPLQRLDRNRSFLRLSVRLEHSTGAAR